jgi:hypothetical protein
MDRTIRRKLDMATRARDFCRAHPSTSAHFTETLAKLEERLARAQTLANQERSGRNIVRASSGTRVNLQRTILESPLKDIVRIARAAADQAELSRLLRLPHPRANRQTFLTAARVIAADAAAHKDLFVTNGLPESFVEELTAALDAYELAMTQVHNGTIAHVGARKDLRAVTAEVLAVVNQLDGMNRFRFKADPEMLGGWESATNIAWPDRAPVVDKQPPASGNGGVAEAA